MSKSLKEITEIVHDFSEKRGWNNAIPNQLLVSIYIELSELAEHFQWSTEFEEIDDEKRREIGYEFVDVVFYLFRLADKLDIDIEKYFMEKLPKLEEKFPIDVDEDVWRKAHDEYRKTGKNKLYE